MKTTRGTDMLRKFTRQNRAYQTDPKGAGINRQLAAERESCLDSQDNNSAGVRMYNKYTELVQRPKA